MRILICVGNVISNGGVPIGVISVIQRISNAQKPIFYAKIADMRLIWRVDNQIAYL